MSLKTLCYIKETRWKSPHTQCIHNVQTKQINRDTGCPLLIYIMYGVAVTVEL